MYNCICSYHDKPVSESGARGRKFCREIFNLNQITTLRRPLKNAGDGGPAAMCTLSQIDRDVLNCSQKLAGVDTMITFETLK